MTGGASRPPAATYSALVSSTISGTRVAEGAKLLVDGRGFRMDHEFGNGTAIFTSGRDAAREFAH